MRPLLQDEVSARSSDSGTEYGVLPAPVVAGSYQNLANANGANTANNAVIPRRQ
jgi:hypothetical protein